MALLDDSMMNKTYPGPPLTTDRHIRLLLLEPGDEHAPVQCQLVASTITEAPTYEALSYVWGNPAERMQIYIRAEVEDSYQEYWVTMNCYTALRRIRLTERPRTMWIDAICVNQSDFSERSYQVTLMSDIYSQALGVLAYIGEATADSDLALEYLLHLSKSEWDTDLPYRQSDKLAHALNEFFGCPYFNRVWVIQEIIFARAATIFYGTRTFDWYILESFKRRRVPHWIDRLPYVVLAKNRHEDEDGHYEQYSRKEPLLHHLLETRHCQATDPRDKILSLLPYFQNVGYEVDLVPDYNKSTAEVYTDCATSLVLKSGIEVLRAVQSRPDIVSLPSWVPDWTIPLTRDHSCIGIDYQSSRGDSYRARAIHYDFDESKDIRRNEQRSILQVFGYCKGQVIQLGSTYVAGGGPFPLQEWDDLLDMALDMQDEPEMSVTLSSFLCLGCSWESTVRRLADPRVESIPLPYRDIPFWSADSETSYDCLARWAV
ncbi:heterokaryon incompatibility protein-domain-containing protein [Phaeosphaeria sp. MPI-PUGE-AT-0046c]|nr:heterokaryon incompatibility protein-domain-containing protein [Phaeosphaeria sp. MPI-PUGE-AT-0046c]